MINTGGINNPEVVSYRDVIYLQIQRYDQPRLLTHTLSPGTLMNQVSKCTIVTIHVKTSTLSTLHGMIYIVMF